MNFATHTADSKLHDTLISTAAAFFRFGKIRVGLCWRAIALRSLYNFESVVFIGSIYHLDADNVIHNGIKATGNSSKSSPLKRDV